jgi:hypothetical protein
MILPAAFYECETWFLTFTKGHSLRVLQKRVFNRIFGPARDEVTGRCRKVHNEELSNLYLSSDITRMIKSRKMRWPGHVTRMERLEMRTKFWLESLKVRNNSEDLGVDGKIILKWTVGKWGWREWIEFIRLSIVTSDRLL